MKLKQVYLGFRDNFFVFKIAHKVFEHECQRKYIGPHDISILASNCVGGEIYHNLNLPFNSPTINLWMHQNDFLKFIKDLDYYLNSYLYFSEEMENKCGHPVGMLGEDNRAITIYFLHYKTSTEAHRKWEERKTRLIKDKLCLIMCDRDGISYDNIVEFGSIPAYRRILFTYKDYPEFSYTHKMPRDGDNPYVINYQMKKWNGFWKWEFKFDCVKWLNGDYDIN